MISEMYCEVRGNPVYFQARGLIKCFVMTEEEEGALNGEREISNSDVYTHRCKEYYGSVQHSLSFTIVLSSNLFSKGMVFASSRMGHS